MPIKFPAGNRLNIVIALFKPIINYLLGICKQLVDWTTRLDYWTGLLDSPSFDLRMHACICSLHAFQGEAGTELREREGQNSSNVWLSTMTNKIGGEPGRL